MKRAFIILFAVCALLALPGSFVHAGTIKAPPSANGLVGYWSFNEGTSTRAADYSGYNRTIPLIGAATWVGGKYSNGISITGSSNDRMNITGVVDSDPNVFSFSAWIKPTGVGGAGGDAIFVHRSETTRLIQLVLTGDSTLAFSMRSDADSLQTISYSSKNFVSCGCWSHVAFVFNIPQNRHELYVDGRLVGTNTTNFGSETFTSAAQFLGVIYSGSYSAGFTGSMDEVRVYDRALTAADMAQLYGAGAVRRKVVSQNGLIGHWRFDEGTSTRANDSSGNGNTGTLLNMDPATDWVSGKLGKALDFDGTNDRVSLGAVTGLDGVSAFTVSGWYYKPTGVATQGAIFSEQTSITSWNAVQLFGTAAVTMIVSNGGTSFGSFVSSSATQLDGWHHYVMVFDGTQTGNANRLKFYLDGVQRSLSFTGTIPATAATFTSTGYIGFDTQNSTYTNGIIDDVRIYNRALSLAEVTSLYGSSQTARRQVSENGLVGYWSFNEGTSTVATDYSGRGNNGTLTNMVSATDWVTGKVGKALDFDGTNDYVEMGVRPDAQFTHTDPWSISGWVYPTSNSGIQGIISYTPSAGGNFGWYLEYDNGTVVTRGLFFDYWVSGTIVRIRTQNNDVPLNQWTHIAMVKTGNTAVQSAYKLYVNGVDRTTVVGSGTPSASIAYTGMALRIGNKAATQHYQGKIDDMRLHSRALSESEVRALYDLGR